MRRYFAGRLPSSYRLMHLSTTGLDPDDLIVAVSSMTVDNGTISNRVIHLLDWGRYSAIATRQWLEQRLLQVPARCRIAPERLERDGQDPFEILANIAAWTWTLPRGSPIAGHNIVGFGWPWLGCHVQQWLPGCQVNPLTPLFDIGLFHKACAAHICPMNGQPRNHFFWTVSQARVQVRWSLDYLVEKEGVHVDPVDPFYELNVIRALYDIIAQRLSANAPSTELQAQCSY